MILKKLVGLKLCARSSLPYIKPVPKPTARIPDVDTFLREIGRGCSAYSSKFSSWSDLFQATGKQLKERGMPVVVRKYILKWTEYFRLGKEPVEYPMSEKQAKKKKFPIFK